MNRLLTLLAPLVLASALLASVQVADGKYATDGSNSGSTGTVLVTNNGADLAFVSDGGAGGIWKWGYPPEGYTKEDPNGGAFAVFVPLMDPFGDPIPGYYKWQAWGPGGSPAGTGILVQR